MAIVQISRITQRKGLQENLPQLAGAEFGWSIDERRLFIGNGTLEEGAPVIGNTEILTEFSDIFQFQSTYTYKGEAAGYTAQTGVTPGTPITQSLQSWLDQFATVKDFGAVGDGIADDTAAINRALFQLFCRETNPQIRRSLFFPAGVYKVSETIIVPPFATLYGEGANNSVIQMTAGDDSALRAYVARTGDSLQQTGVNIGNNGALVPQYVTISNMGFSSLDAEVDIFLVEDASNCRFQNVGFFGPLGTGDLNTDADNTAGVRFASTSSLVTTQIVFDDCLFQGTTYGANTDDQISAVSFTNSRFNVLYKGLVLGEGTVTNGGATGVRAVGNMFDNIYAQGIVFGDVQLNASGHNIFYDVGNHFNGVINPETSIIEIQSDNNVSISDMFERADVYATVHPRIEIAGTTSIAMTNSKQLAMGTYVRETGQSFVLVNNTSSATTIFSVDTDEIKTFRIDYSIARDVDFRTGTMIVATGGSFTDDYVENSSTGVTLTVSQVSTTLSVQYTTDNTGFNGTFNYSISRLN